MHAVDVLVVAAEAPARLRLSAEVWRALPSAQIGELSQVGDLVYRIAGGGIDLVVLDAAPPQLLPLTPLLVKMLKGIQPALRIVCVAPFEPAAASGTDASLSWAGLGDWLRTTYGSAGPGAAASASSHPPA